MGDIYVVSVGARERLLAAAEQYEDHYVVSAGLEPDLLRSVAWTETPGSIGLPAVLDDVSVPSGSGRG